MWDYVCDVCDDIISEDEWNEGHSNSGLTIDAIKSVIISKKLNLQIESGKAQSYIDTWEARRKLAEKHNEGLKKGAGDKNYEWIADYPLDIDNIQHFADFCLDSGGFQIC